MRLASALWCCLLLALVVLGQEQFKLLKDEEVLATDADVTTTKDGQEVWHFANFERRKKKAKGSNPIAPVLLEREEEIESAPLLKSRRRQHSDEEEEIPSTSLTDSSANFEKEEESGGDIPSTSLDDREEIPATEIRIQKRNNGQNTDLHYSSSSTEPKKHKMRFQEEKQQAAPVVSTINKDGAADLQGKEIQTEDGSSRSVQASPPALLANTPDQFKATGLIFPKGLTSCGYKGPCNSDYFKATELVGGGSNLMSSLTVTPTISATSVIPNIAVLAKNHRMRFQEAPAKTEATATTTTTSSAAVPLQDSSNNDNNNVFASSSLQPSSSCQQSPVCQQVFNATKMIASSLCSGQPAAHPCRKALDMYPALIVDRLPTGQRYISSPISQQMTPEMQMLQKMSETDPIAKNIMNHVQRLNTKIVTDSKWIEEVQKIIRYYSKKILSVRSTIRDEARGIVELKKALVKRMKDSAQSALMQKLANVNANLAAVKKKAEAMNTQAKQIEAVKRNLARSVTSLASQITSLNNRITR